MTQQFAALGVAKERRIWWKPWRKALRCDDFIWWTMRHKEPTTITARLWTDDSGDLLFDFISSETDRPKTEETA